MLALVKEYFWIFFISMVPIVELRGAVPAGLAMGLPVIPTYIVSVIGNMLPVPVILLFAKAVLLWCTKLPGGLGRFFMKIYDKGVKAGEKMQAKAGRGIYWALFLFVAIPLPGTGAWTGCLAATLLDLKFWPSVLAGAVRRHDGRPHHGRGLGWPAGRSWHDFCVNLLRSTLRGDFPPQVFLIFGPSGQAATGQFLEKYQKLYFS